MKLVKSHGLGNDYLVLASGEPLSPERVRALCDRHCGVGSDGVLEPVPSERADHGLRIWNPDGSLAEKSGNGLRIFSRWLVDHAAAAPRHTIEVAAGVVQSEVHPDGAVTVEMGAATFAPAAIPCARPLIDASLSVAGVELRVTAVGMGNPHCVVFAPEGAELDALPWRDWGREIEVHPLFPNRTNVQVAAVRSRGVVEARVWERGAGPTLASGSSACAVAAAARRLGHVDAAVDVVMPGGTLQVWVETDNVRLRGPVEEIAVVNLSRPLP